MADDNRPIKYIRYAIGEIVLVVIGILIALQINTWNSERKNRIQEIQILTQLQREYNTNLEELNKKISIRDVVLNSCSLLLSYIDYPEKEPSQNNLSLHMGRSIGNPTFDPALGVTNELINSGKLYLLTSKPLRFSLSSWTSDVDKLQEVETIILDFGKTIYFPYLAKNYPYRNIMDQSIKDTNFNKKFELSKSKSNIVIGKSKQNIDLSTLINSDFEDYLTHIIFWTNLANIQSQGLKTKIENIQKLINEELNKTEK